MAKFICTFLPICQYFLRTLYDCSTVVYRLFYYN